MSKQTRSIEIPLVLYSNIEEAARHYAAEYDLQHGTVPLLDALVRNYVENFSEDFLEKDVDSISQYIYQGETPTDDLDADQEEIVE